MHANQYFYTIGAKLAEPFNDISYPLLNDSIAYYIFKFQTVSLDEVQNVALGPKKFSSV